jgi:hypothetical protein
LATDSRLPDICFVAELRCSRTSGRGGRRSNGRASHRCSTNGE